MRLGRSAAALGAAAALVVAGSAVSTPAFADEEDGFTVNSDYTGVADPSVPFTVSGTGCVAPDAPSSPGDPVTPDNPDSTDESVTPYAPSSPNGSDSGSTRTSLMWAVGEGGQGAQGTGTVNSDGSWSATINLAAAGVKDQQRTTLSFACLDYNNNTIKSLGLSLQADSTTLDGSYTLTSEADGSQTIAVEVTGFAPNEEATFRLVPENAYNSETGPVEGDFTVLSTFTADAKGAVSHRFTAPVDVPDGRYKAGVFGIAYGEHAWFQNVLVKSGKMYYVDDGSGTGQAGGDDNAQQPAPGVEDPAAPADPGTDDQAAPAKKPAAEPKPAETKAAASAPAKKGLANTGADLGVVLVAAGFLASGAVVLASRRKA